MINKLKSLVVVVFNKLRNSKYPVILLTGTFIAVLSCLFVIEATIQSSDSAGFYSDLFGNSIFGWFAGGIVDSINGGGTDVTTTGIFVGSSNRMRSIGVTFIIWTVITVILFAKNKKAHGIVSSLQVLVLDIIMIYYFIGHSAGSFSGRYTSVNYVHGFGFKLLWLAAIVLVIGILKECMANRELLFQQLKIDKSFAVLVAGWGITVFCLVTKRWVFKWSTMMIIYNAFALVFLFLQLKGNKTMSVETVEETVEDSGIVYCAYCGKENPSKSDFCAYCGKPIK